MRRYNFLFFFLFFFLIGYIFFLLTAIYPNSTFDHISYLYGPLNLYQNISPGYLHAPGGIYFWMGYFYLQFEFIINFLINLKLESSIIENFYFTSDKILTSNYKNLFNLKIFYNSVSFLLLVSIVYVICARFENYKLNIFFVTICLGSGFLFKFLIQPTPYVLSWLLSILSILFLKKNRVNYSIFFASLALSIRFETIFLILLILSIKWNDKIFLKKLLISSLCIFLITNPWTLIAPYGTIKTLFSFFFLVNSKNILSVDLFSLTYFIIIFLISLYFLYIKNIKFSFYLILLLNIIFIIYFFQSIHAEKHLGIIVILNFIIILYYADKDIINKNKYIFFITFIALLLINFNNFNKIYYQKKFNEIIIVKWIENNIPQNSMILKPQTIYELDINAEHYEKIYKDYFSLPNKVYNKKVNKNYNIFFDEKNFSFMDINSHVNRSNFIRYLFLSNKSVPFKVYFEGTNYPYFFSKKNIPAKSFYLLTKRTLDNNNLIKRFDGNYKLYLLDK